ncbi:amino acid ABC transporter ATP-binding protein [Martelella sp. HB161492]|uniref:amino acid ABC transporter ATP-binding protein n=1 Tax=Martelella sp. HB161492 TaxID=2720726 RepID=UPI001590EA44|nr:amino acid ABC transporter ATP-binding protein [Martelella sp. HB161492]
MSHSSDVIVECSNVVAGFGSNAIVKDVSLDVKRGEVVAIIGPSGSGKTTFLRCINHLHPISSGFILVDDAFVGYEARPDGTMRVLPEKKIAASRRSIGFVFQRFNLFPHRTALGNVTEAPVRVLGMHRDEAEARGRELLARVGLADKIDSYPGSLSGGQMQRVAIARALAMNPKIFLFDEPTSALDPEMVGEVVSVIRDLASQGMTMIAVSHEMRFVREISDRVVVFDQGRIVETAPPEKLFTDPENSRTRDFLSKIA